jgi:hypothetical protein
VQGDPARPVEDYSSNAVYEELLPDLKPDKFYIKCMDGGHREANRDYIVHHLPNAERVLNGNVFEFVNYSSTVIKMAFDFLATQGKINDRLRTANLQSHAIYPLYLFAVEFGVRDLRDACRYFTDVFVSAHFHELVWNLNNDLLKRIYCDDLRNEIMYQRATVIKVRTDVKRRTTPKQEDVLGVKSYYRPASLPNISESPGFSDYQRGGLSGSNAYYKPPMSGPQLSSQSDPFAAFGVPQSPGSPVGSPISPNM